MYEKTMTSLPEETELRQRLNETFDRIIAEIKKVQLIKDPKDLDALAWLLHEVIETRKTAEEQEKQLKAEIKRFIPQDTKMLNLERVIIFLTPSKSSTIDRKALIEAFGTEVVEKFMVPNYFDKMTVRVK